MKMIRKLIRRFTWNAFSNSKSPFHVHEVFLKKREFESDFFIYFQKWSEIAEEIANLRRHIDIYSEEMAEESRQKKMLEKYVMKSNKRILCLLIFHSFKLSYILWFFHFGSKWNVGNDV